MRRGWLLALFGLAVVGPFLSGADGMTADWNAVDTAPGSVSALQGGHWLGTDELGRDAWVRLCLGLRGSLLVTGLAAAAALVLGSVTGCCSGALPLPLRAIAARILDLVAALPLTLLALVVASVQGRGLAAVAGVLGVLGSVPVARAVRLAWLHVSTEPHDWVLRLHGASLLERFRWNFLPAAAAAAREAGTLLLPQLVFAEGLLGFLGLSLPDPGVTLGGLLAEGSARLTVAPWAVVAPGLLVCVLLLAMRGKAA